MPKYNVYKHSHLEKTLSVDHWSCCLKCVAHGPTLLGWTLRTFYTLGCPRNKFRPTYTTL